MEVFLEAGSIILVDCCIYALHYTNCLIGAQWLIFVAKQVRLVVHECVLDPLDGFIYGFEITKFRFDCVFQLFDVT
jgi:hypothetical protein